MARGCSDPAMSNSRPASPTSTLQECEVPTIQLQDSVCEEDDDDAAVFLQMLGPNYAITARSKSSKLSFASKESRQSSAVSSALSRQKSTRNLVDVTTRLTHSNEGQLYRLLSAKRNHIQQLSNDVSLLHNRIKELEEQNRLLLRVSKRQEAALTRYHDMKSELPHILEAHKLEINVLQEKLRRSTEENRKNTERLKTGDNRILKLTEEATKLRELNRKRNLPERDQLNKQLIAATRTLHEKEKEVAELKRRIGILEKALKQQVQAEVGRHRATARKLYNLQCDHHELQEILKEREHELESLKQYSLSTGSGATADSACTTAPSSRSGSLSARHKRGSSSSGTTSTSGVVCPVDTLSATESRMSFALEATGRLPPISAEARRHKDIDSLIGSPEPLPRRTRHRSHSIVKDGSEERRLGRVRRSRRVSKEEGFLFNSRCTPSPSPSTTPEPHAHRSDPDGDALEDGSHCPLGNNDDRRRHRDDSHSTSDQGDHEHEDKDTNGSDDNKPSLRREFSLIEHYPPRERVTLHGGSSAGGSDSGSGTSGTPPPPAPPPSKPLIDARPPPHLARTSGPGRGSLHRRNNMKAKDLRVSSSLTKLDSETSPKPVRTAITP